MVKKNDRKGPDPQGHAEPRRARDQEFVCSEMSCVRVTQNWKESGGSDFLDFPGKFGRRPSKWTRGRGATRDAVSDQRTGSENGLR